MSALASPIYPSSAQALTRRALLKLPARKPCLGSSTGKKSQAKPILSLLTSGMWWLRQKSCWQWWQSWPRVVTEALQRGKPHILSASIAAEIRASKSSSATLPIAGFPGKGEHTPGLGPGNKPTLLQPQSSLCFYILRCGPGTLLSSSPYSCDS